jgi:hypothetical protein
MCVALMLQSDRPIKSPCNSEKVQVSMLLGMTRLGLVGGCLFALPAAAAPVHRAPGSAAPGNQPALEEELDSLAAGSQSSSSLLHSMLLPGLNVTPVPFQLFPGGNITEPTLPGDDWSGEDAANSPSAPGLLRGLAPQPIAANREDCNDLKALSADDRLYWSAQARARFPVSDARSDMAGLVEIESGGVNQMASVGPMRVWCRPPTEPFSESSPLVSRSVWTPIFLLTFGIAAFLATRGWRLPP